MKAIGSGTSGAGKRQRGNGHLPNQAFPRIIITMTALEVIDQIKHLPPTERVMVNRFVVENESSMPVCKCTVAVSEDGLPVIRANGGVITSCLVRELETLTP